MFHIRVIVRHILNHLNLLLTFRLLLLQGLQLGMLAEVDHIRLQLLGVLLALVEQILDCFVEFQILLVWRNLVLYWLKLVELDLLGVLVRGGVEIVHLLAHLGSLRARPHLVGEPHLILPFTNRLRLLVPRDLHRGRNWLAFHAPAFILLGLRIHKGAFFFISVFGEYNVFLCLLIGQTRVPCLFRNKGGDVPVCCSQIDWLAALSPDVAVFAANLEPLLASVDSVAVRCDFEVLGDWPQRRFGERLVVLEVQPGSVKPILVAEHFEIEELTVGIVRSNDVL